MELIGKLCLRLLFLILPTVSTFSVKKGQNFKKVLGLELGLVLVLVSKSLCMYRGAV